MGYSVKDHRLWKDGKPVPFRQTPNMGGAIRPSLFVPHYTVTGSAQSAISTLCDPKRKASAHLVLDRDGEVTQLAPFNRSTWHAGESQYPRGKRGARTGCNGFSIGMEIVNWGWLDKRADGKFTPRGTSVIVPPSDVIETLHQDGCGSERYWQSYPAEQIEAAAEIARAICAAYDIRDIAGHDDICLPGPPRPRKRDPGPAFPRDFVGLVFGRADAKAKAQGAYFDALMMGEKGARVKKLQEALNLKAGAAIKADGDFGAKTKAAVIAFQKSLGVEKPSGEVGRFTWTKLGLAA